VHKANFEFDNVEQA